MIKSKSACLACAQLVSVAAAVPGLDPIRRSGRSRSAVIKDYVSRAV